MHRTQVYLSEEEIELLDRQSKVTGASRSELIRRAVRSSYGTTEADLETKREILRRAAGLWKDRNLTAAEYLEERRRPTRERRERLGLE